ncbi:MAG: Fe-S type hydro-lyase tartrate/fumarate beta region, partial [Polaromonas sp.]|nr:Fe-S type hydro-lyase tartrate/fumarate beta region [Polaromonas sp.]
DGEIVVTAGLPTHHRLIGCLDGKEPLPMPLEGKSLFHLGSYSEEVKDGGKDSLALLYINPTTSTRFNPVMPRLISELKFHAIGGKGGLDAHSVEAMRKVGCVYLSFLGGGATLHTREVREVLVVGLCDLLMNYRLVRLRVEGLGPVTVAIDAHGNSSYADAQAHAASHMDDIMAFMDAGRASFSAKKPC